MKFLSARVYFKGIGHVSSCLSILLMFHLSGGLSCVYSRMCATVCACICTPVWRGGSAACIHANVPRYARVYARLCGVGAQLSEFKCVCMRVYTQCVYMHALCMLHAYINISTYAVTYIHHMETGPQHPGYL